MTTEFVIYEGWNSSHIGWFWGGMTIQGILPYYYNIVTKPNRSIKVNRCIYNTMADVAECDHKPLEMIKSVHFTVCLKPWYCNFAGKIDMCIKLHNR